MPIRHLTAIAVAAVLLGTAVQAHAQQITRAKGSGFSAPSATLVPFAGTDLMIDVTGVLTNGLEEEAGNTVRFYQLLPGALVDATSFSVSLTAYSPSWRSEMTISFLNSSGDGVYLAAGAADAAPGSGTYTDSVNLSDFGLAFNVGSDGLLRVEFFESFDDPEVDPDGLFVSGSVTFSNVVPEPATYGMMALGLLAVGAAARRRARG
jgi:hypothetical protein